MKAKLTLTIDADLIRRARERAARDGATASDVVEQALRRLLDEPQQPRELRSLPRFEMGPFPVDISDRDALYGCSCASTGSGASSPATGTSGASHGSR